MRIGAQKVPKEELGYWIEVFTNAHTTLNETLVQCTTLKSSLTNLIIFKNSPVSDDIESTMITKVDDFIKVNIQDKRFDAERGDSGNIIGLKSYYNTYMKIFDVLMDVLRDEKVSAKLIHSLEVTVRSTKALDDKSGFLTAYMSENNITTDDIRYSLYSNIHRCDYFIADNRKSTHAKIRWSVGLYYFIGKEQRRIGDINVMINRIKLEIQRIDSLLCKMQEVLDPSTPKRFYQLRTRSILLDVIEKRNEAVKEITETLRTGIIISID